MDFEYLVTSIPGMLIAGTVGYFVMVDATKLRSREIAATGESKTHPHAWGIGVFALLIVFLPAYLIVKSARVSKLPNTSQRQVFAPVASAGWFADPYAQRALRYWDGGKWTEHVHDSQADTAEPPRSV